MSDKIEVDDIYEGKVLKIKPFGAIISLPGNRQGLVHISHISSSYVQSVDDHLSLGDLVKVKVLSIDATTNKISLSMKDANQTIISEVNDPPESEPRPRTPSDNSTFEERFKEWVKISNERQAGLNKRNKRR